ncbi:hypothetical protein [Segetibacter aerophilus]|nr:hypothetical protein [Segetibacter aerophilus]
MLNDCDGSGDYQVWTNGEHVFTIYPDVNVRNNPCWQLKPEFEGVETTFICNIGMQIERHYL